ncbi:hypothetical protein MMC13_000711 [Lambiella insularis]|nr:hypothetical protein [Lambiella insularis]
MPARQKILFVVSSSSQGWYLPELAHPYDVLSRDFAITIASPQGGATVLDPASVQLFTDSVSTEFKKTKEKLWKETEELKNFIGKAADYEAILYIGGFGPMFDLVDNTISHQLIREFWEAGKIVSAVCHGAAALLKVTLANGDLLIKDHRVTGFSNQEEIDVDRQKDMPFHLETTLNEASNGFYEKADAAWGPKVIVTANGKLLTGQNPSSAEPLAKELRKVLQGAAPYTL